MSFKLFVQNPQLTTFRRAAYKVEERSRSKMLSRFNRIVRYLILCWIQIIKMGLNLRPWPGRKKLYFFLFLVCNSVCRPWAKLVTEPSSEEVGTANFPKSFAVGFHLLTTLFSIVPSAQDQAGTICGTFV